MQCHFLLTIFGSYMERKCVFFYKFFFFYYFHNYIHNHFKIIFLWIWQEAVEFCGSPCINFYRLDLTIHDKTNSLGVVHSTGAKPFLFTYFEKAISKFLGQNISVYCFILNQALYEFKFERNIKIESILQKQTLHSLRFTTVHRTIFVLNVYYFQVLSVLTGPDWMVLHLTKSIQIIFEKNFA